MSLRKKMHTMRKQFLERHLEMEAKHEVNME